MYAVKLGSVEPESTTIVDLPLTGYDANAVLCDDRQQHNIATSLALYELRSKGIKDGTATATIIAVYHEASVSEVEIYSVQHTVNRHLRD